MSKHYSDGSVRPYVNREEFDQSYPVSFRPYVGIVDNSTGQPISQTLPIITQHSGIRNNIGIGARMRPLVTKPRISYKRNMYADLEWKEYFDLSNLKQLLISLFHSFVANYSKLIFSQPFEIARLLQQVGSFSRQAGARRKQLEPSSGLTALESDSDEEGASHYFEKVTPTLSAEDPGRIGSPTSSEYARVSNIERSPRLERKRASPTTTQVVHSSVKIEPQSLKTFDIISSLVSREGPRGILKAINTSFIVNTLQYTVQSWISGFIAGLLGIPDPLFVDLSHSPNANLSFALSMFSHVVTSVLLSQFSLIRMKFIVTTSTRGMRSFKDIVMQLPRFAVFKIPASLLGPSLVTNIVRAFTKHYPDYLITCTMGLSKYTNPYVYNALSLVMRVAGLFIRLPFETLYNRAQVHCLLTDSRIPNVMRVDPDDLCIRFGGYYGYVSTLYYILAGTKPVDYGNDNSLKTNVTTEVEDKDELNKGVRAIFRGWQVGLVKLVSGATLDMLANQGEGSEEQQL